MKKQNIRSEYIKNLMEDKEILSNKFADATKDTIKQILGESVNQELRNILSEADDNEYEEEEVDAVPNPEEFQEEPEKEEEESMEDSDDDVWGELEDVKDEDGEYDLTGMEKDDVVKVLQSMSPEDGVRVVKDADDTITLTDDNTEKEYVIDISDDEPTVSVEEIDDDEEGDSEIEVSLGDEDEEPEIEVDLDGESEEDDDVDLEGDDDDDMEDEFEIDVDDTDDDIHESHCVGQCKTAMTTPANFEPSKGNRTWDRVPTGTEKRFGKKVGNSQPYDVNESEDEVEVEMDEATTVGGFAMSNSTAKSHDTDTVSRRASRNGSKGGIKVKSTSEPRYDTNENLMRKANVIFNENRQLKGLLNNLKSKLEESIVINASLGKIIQLVTENTTSREEKLNIVERFDNVKTIQESKDLYETISKELKSVNNVSKANKVLDNQINENNTRSNQSNMLLETSIYKSTDLSNTLDLMERMSKIK